MKFSELVHAVWKDERIRELGIRKKEVNTVIKVTLDYIRVGLLSYGLVKLHGLFTLDLRKSKSKRISNPQTGEPMYTSEYYRVGLKPSKKLKEEMEELE